MADSTMRTPERQFSRIIEQRRRNQERVLGIEHPSLRLFALNDAGRLTLRAELPPGLKLSGLRSTVGIEVRIDTPDDGPAVLAFVSREQAMDPVFLAFVRHAIDQTLDAGQETDAVTALIEAYERFVEFMTREKVLGPGALKGLYSELAVLHWLMDQGVDPSTAVMGWKGPYGSSKDFVLPDGRAFEVKSAALNATRIGISNLDQLEANGLSLHLCLVHLERAALRTSEAESVASLVDRLRKRLVAGGADPAHLDLGLKQYGLSLHDAENREAAFVAKPPREFAVVDSFPRITRSGVPDGVLSVSYEIALDALAPFEVEEA